MTRSRGLLVAATAAVVLLTNACGGSASNTQVTVLAASSLTESFTQLAADFEAEHPGVDVRLSFGPSDGLAQQIVEGAPADVFASASPRWMDVAATEGPGINGIRDVARNRLVVVTPVDDPAGIASFDDLAEPGVQLVLAAEGVPVGDYAREALDNAGIGAAAEGNVVSNEEDAKAVLNRIILGEADAGIVYVTDVTPVVEPDVRTVEIPEDMNVIATYPIGIVDGGPAPELAAEFVALVTGPEGQTVLREHGFLPAT